MVRYSACGPTVGELIEALKSADQNEIVKIYDPDAEGHYPITGFTYNNGEVMLYCDSDEMEEDEEDKQPQGDTNEIPQH